MKKRLISLVMMICMAVILIVPAGATNINQGLEKSNDSEINYISINEYDHFKMIQEKPEQELLEMGYTEKDVHEIKAFSYEEALLERAKLSDNELSNLGYSSSQIAILRSYSGEAITSDSPVLAAVPTLTGNTVVTKLNTTPVSLRVKYNWTWSSAPVQCYTDIVGIQAVLSDSAGYSLTPKVTSRSGYAYYIDAQNGAQTATALTTSPNSNSPFNACKSSFPVKKVIDTFTVRYAMRGYIQMAIRVDYNGPVNPDQ